jgi:hypothetical protein
MGWVVVVVVLGDHTTIVSVITFLAGRRAARVGMEVEIILPAVAQVKHVVVFFLLGQIIPDALAVLEVVETLGRLAAPAITEAVLVV